MQILAFPCNQFGQQERGTAEDISQFVTKKYEVTFPVMAKTEVNGESQHELWEHLKRETGVKRIGWNFEMFLADSEGKVVGHYTREPETLRGVI